MSAEPSLEKESGESKNKEYPTFLISTVLLFLFWIIISLPFSLFTGRGVISILQNTLIGIPVAALVTYVLAYPVAGNEELKNHPFPVIMRLTGYIFFLFKEILVAGVDVARRVMRKDIDISPGVIKFRTPLRDELQVVMNANSITLTPGTITLDVEVDEKGSTFWVHCISKEGLKATREGKGFVDKILDIYTHRA